MIITENLTVLTCAVKRESEMETGLGRTEDVERTLAAALGAADRSSGRDVAETADHRPARLCDLTYSFDRLER